MPSHQTSPSSVSATLVNSELPRRERAHRVGVGLPVGPRRHPEQAELGVDRVQPAVVTEPHPGDVVAERLDLPARDGGLEHRQVGLAAGRRERRGDVVDLPLRRGELEDQHVLGQPALVAGHHAGDPQRVALLAQQRVAAVPGTERPDLPRLRELGDVLGLVAGPGHVLLARLQRRARPSAAPARTPRPCPSPRSTAVPIRVMMCIDATTYAESVISTPNIGCSASSGPMQNGMTYIVRPRMQPRYSSVISRFISPGSIQLLVGPASASSTEQMKVRSSTRATSVGSVRAQNELGFFSSFSRTRAPDSTSSSVRRRHSSCDPSHQTIRPCRCQPATSLTQASSPACCVGAFPTGNRGRSHVSSLQSTQPKHVAARHGGRNRGFLSA